jgi:hypothetical protein
MAEKFKQQILEAYRPSSESSVGSKILAWGGLVGLLVGAVDKNIGSAIAGATCWATLVGAEAVDYARAYMEAKLDFQANGRYTRLDEKK